MSVNLCKTFDMQKLILSTYGNAQPSKIYSKNLAAAKPAFMYDICTQGFVSYETFDIFRR